jgi:hypothetical protein
MGFSNEIYIVCEDWQRPDGLQETLLYDFKKYTPEKGDFIYIDDENKKGEYKIISRSFDFDDSKCLTGMRLHVERM